MEYTFLLALFCFVLDSSIQTTLQGGGLLGEGEEVGAKVSAYAYDCVANTIDLCWLD